MKNYVGQTLADTKKMSEYGWKATYSLESGIDELINPRKSHPIRISSGAVGDLLLSIRQLWFDIRIFFGAKICGECGSSNLMEHGFVNHNLRYTCNDCGTTTYLDSI